MVNAYRLLASKCDYPLHLGVTEAGPIFQGTIKSATAFGILLSEGIGDTIRVSLSAPPVEEVQLQLHLSAMDNHTLPQEFDMHWLKRCKRDCKA